MRTAHGIKGTRQKIVIIHNPGKIDQNQLLLVRFPNLGSDDVIVPETVNLSFNIKLDSTTDKNRMLVSNIGRVKGKKLEVKFEGNEILNTDDFDLFRCQQDLWKMKSEKQNAVRQDIAHGDGCTFNCMKLKIDAKDKSDSNARDNAIANTYGDKFIHFEMLDSSISYYQLGLGN